jgi:hypothetical protein
MALRRSVAFSILASIIATMALRRILSVSQPLEDAGKRSQVPFGVVVVMPVFVGNSSNRIGWIKEDHHHRHPLWGRARR